LLGPAWIGSGLKAIEYTSAHRPTEPLGGQLGARRSAPRQESLKFPSPMPKLYRWRREPPPLAWTDQG